MKWNTPKDIAIQDAKGRHIGVIFGVIEINDPNNDGRFFLHSYKSVVVAAILRGSFNEKEMSFKIDVAKDRTN